MAEQENTAVVRGIYESFKAGDIDTVLTGMTEDIEWQLPEIAGVPFSGKRQGHNSIREFFASVVESQDVGEMELDAVIAQGDAVVVLGHYTWRVKSTGRAFTSDFAHAFQMTGGKIARFQRHPQNGWLHARDAHPFSGKPRPDCV